jgi:exodeoxyribonuclease V
MITLTPDQLHAVGTIACRLSSSAAAGTVATLSGFAGVGKTTVVSSAIHQLLLHTEFTQIAVCAPTHKALAVLQSKLGVPDAMDSLEFLTVHQLLGLRIKELSDGSTQSVASGLFSQGRAAQFDAIIIDESSMLSPEHYATLMSQRGRARILFVGDPMQLPPVDTGALSPVFDPTVVPTQIKLNQVLRQAEANPIIRWASNIRQCIETNIPIRIEWLANELTDQDASALAISSGGESTIEQMAVSAIKTGLDARVLCFDNQSVVRHNKAVHNAIYGPLAQPFEVGEPVTAQSRLEVRSVYSKTIVQNNEAMTVTNCQVANEPDELGFRYAAVHCKRDDGSVATLTVCLDRELLERQIAMLFNQVRTAKNQNQRALAERLSGQAWALRRKYHDIRHSYAMTIHKSQGSTFDAAIVDWHSAQSAPPGTDISRLLYVAVTRPSKHCVIVTQ